MARGSALRFFLTLAVGLVFVPACFAAATNAYVTPSGSAVGNCPAGTGAAPNFTPSQFNNSANWGSGTAQIGPGTVVLLCGTFSAPAGSSNYLAFQASGTSGNPITLQFDAGALVTAPYWSGPVINSEGNSFILIDGGANGTVQATANGTNLANQQDNGIGVFMTGSSSSQVKNLTVSNIYVHSCTLPISSCTDEGGQNTYGIVWNGGSNVQIGPNNTVHDMKWCTQYGYEATSNAQIFQNTLYGCDHGVVFGDAAAAVTTGPPTATCGGANGNMICQNTIYDGGNWDDAGDENHHDGIHCWANNAPTSKYYVIIADNYIYGNWGADMGSLIYVESDEQGIPVINNLLVSTFSPIAGTGILGIATGTGVGGSGIRVADNTIVGASSSNSQAGIMLESTTNATIENNIVSTTGTAVFINSSGVTGTTANYNDYYNIGTANPFYCPGNFGVSFGTWQSACGFDANGSTGNPLLNSSYAPASGSAAIDLGINLWDLGITSLDTDKSGTTRPTTGSSNFWTAGAFQSTATSNPPNAPSGLVAVPH